MIIKRKELTDAVRKVYASTSTASDNDPMARKDCFIFTGDFIAGYNGFFAIITPFETDFICTVNAALFQSIIASLRSDEVSLIQKEGMLYINCGNVEAEIAADPDFEGKDFLESELNLPHIDDTDTWNKLPEDFVPGMELCFFSALKKNSQPYLNAIYINGDKIISGDRTRVSVYTLNKAFDGEALLPLDIAKQVVKFSKEFDFYYISSNSIVFASKESKFFIARTIALQYPDIKNAVNTKTLDMRVKIPDSLTADLETVASVLKTMKTHTLDEDKITESVIVKITKSDIQIHQQTKAGKILTASTHKNKRIKGSFTFSVNPVFLREILNISKTLYIYKPETEGTMLRKGVFKTEKFFHVIALRDITNDDIPF